MDPLCLAIRVLAMGLLALSATHARAQHYVIRLDPANSTAEVRIDNPESDGYSFETLFPSGSIRDGVWDVVLEKVGGPLVGVRVLSFPEFNDTGVLKVRTVRVELHQSRGAFYEGYVRRVPDRFLANLCDGELEPTWVTFEQQECFIGTHAADDDPSSIPAFTLMCSGELRAGLWQENATKRAAPILWSIWPFALERQADGAIWFVVGTLNQSSSHGEIPADMEYENRDTRTLKVPLSPHASQP